MGVEGPEWVKHSRGEMIGKTNPMALNWEKAKRVRSVARKNSAATKLGKRFVEHRLKELGL